MINILVVEDSKFILKRMVATLTKAGFSVEGASNGKEALEKISTHDPVLIFVDLIMPVMDGYALIRSLAKSHPDVKIIVVSATPKKDAWKELQRLGADAYIQKPSLDKELIDIANEYLTIKDDQNINTTEVIPGPDFQAYETHVKACYVCGYDKVKIYKPKKDSTIENWDHGLFPTFKANGRFQEWDFLRSYITVCPSCFFASGDSNDFAIKGLEQAFPYKPDAKKILAMGMASRKKLIGADTELHEDNRFERANRSFEQVIESLRLAEKCANGLVLGDKKTAYSDIGYYCILQAMMSKKTKQDKLREALNSYTHQLKIDISNREVIVRAYYFKISLHIALGESIAANEEKEKLEHYYLDNPTKQPSAKELRWNQRLLFVWKNGFDINHTRELI